MIGILTEKPSAKSNFAKALGGVKGNYNGEEYVIVSSHGHIYEFSAPEEQVAPPLADKYRTWDLNNLPWNEKDFAWKRQLKTGESDTLKNIKTLLKSCDEIVIATDDDPTGEGELIAWEILFEANITAKKYSRMYFVDEAPKSIQKAFIERKTIESMLSDRDYLKADYRSKFDFLTMQFSRIATICGDGFSVLRQGRLKSAMISLVGDGLKAVKEYKKIPYYQIRYKDENGNIFTNPDEPAYPDKTQVPCLDEYSASAIVIDSIEKKSTAPPKLLDLAALSSKLSSKGIKAKDVLSTYQKMYENQIVSYPRTEDKNITPEQFDELLPLADKIAKVVGVDTSLLTYRKQRSTHVKSKGSHGANRPGINVPTNLDELIQYGQSAPLIYEILAKNYLAMLADNYEYEQQKGHLENYPNFTGISNIPLKQGYKAIYSDDEKEEENKETNVGLGVTAAPFIHEGFPTKPPTPTMKWLMKQLEKHDVGTGATRTSTYADITSENVKYPLLSETKGKISMTQYGEMSYTLLPNTHIGNIETTEQLQKDMRGIADGTVNADECLQKIQQWVVDDIETMQINGKAIPKKENNTCTKEVIGKCPMCGNPIYEGEKNYYCSAYEDGCSFKLWKNNKFFEVFGKNITKTTAQSLLKNKKVFMKGLCNKSKNGNKFDAYITVEWEQPYPKFQIEFKH